MPDKCFIIMPISTPKSLLPTYHDDSDHFIHVLDHLFIPAIKKAGLEPIRPQAEGAELIQARIIEHIEKSELVLCDMSALNPNVFFELGIRTAVNKPACMVVDDITEKVPFDTSIVNYHTYKSLLEPWTLEGEIGMLSGHIQAAQEGGERNSLWHYFGLSARAELSGEGTEIEAKVDLINMRLEGMARQLEDRDKPLTASTDNSRSKVDDLMKFLENVATRLGFYNAGLSALVGNDRVEKVVLSYTGNPSDGAKNNLLAIADMNGISLEFQRKKPK